MSSEILIFKNKTFIYSAVPLPSFYPCSVPTQDQALQQVVQLKKELAEMRVSQAMAEDRVLAEATGSSLDREVGRARGLLTPANVEADMERSAHRETMGALECSEASVGSG